MTNIQGLSSNPPIMPQSKDIPMLTNLLRGRINKLSGQLKELLDDPDQKDNLEFLENMKKSIIDLAETSKQIHED